MSGKKVAIIASRGTFDWAYPPFILASTAGALGYEVKMFFTFYGLQLIKKDLDLRFSPLGNPAVPMPFPLPVLAQALPGMEQLMGRMMKDRIKKKNISSVESLRDLCLEADVEFIGCQMSIDMFDFKRSDFLDHVQVGGAATFLAYAADSDISLFI